MESYCMRCKAKRAVKDERTEKKMSRRGLRTYVKGKCVVCDCPMVKIVSSKPEGGD